MMRRARMHSEFFAQPTRSQRQRRAAFTLAELISVAGLGVALGMIVLGISSISSSALATLHGQGMVQMQLNTAVASITQDARLAVLATTGTTGSVKWVSFKVPAIDASGTVLAGKYDFLEYDCNPTTGTLSRVVTADAASRRFTSLPPSQPIAQGFTGADFAATVRDVTITLWARQTEGGRAFDGSLTTQITFRNA